MDWMFGLIQALEDGTDFLGKHMKKILFLGFLFCVVVFWDNIKAAWHGDPAFGPTTSVSAPPAAKPVEPVASGPSAITQWLIDHTPKK